MYDLIKDFIKPELVILIPVIYILGTALKKAPLINDNFIPLILGIVSIILCGIWSFSTTSCYSFQSILTGIFTAVTQGILTAGASVYINQLLKQSANSRKQGK